MGFYFRIIYWVKKLMPYKPYVLCLENLFVNGAITWDSPVIALPYIGQGLAAKLNEQDIFVLRDVVDKVLNAINAAPNNANVADVIFNTIGSWVTNSRANTCVNGTYLPRHINRMGFNVLLELLARTVVDAEIPIEPENLLELGICRWHENHANLAPDGFNAGMPLCSKVQNYGNVGDEPAVKAMRQCPCKNQAQCNGQCVWVGGPTGACLSRVSSPNRRNYARDVLPYSGDWQPEARPLRPNTRRSGPPPNEIGWWYAMGEGPDGPPSPPPSPGPGGGPSPSPSPSPGPPPPPGPRRLNDNPIRRSARIEAKNPRRSARLRDRRR